VIEFDGSTCSFVLEVPSVSDPVVNVGTQQCRVPTSR